jgi:DNA mismatch repair protein MutL
LRFKGALILSAVDKLKGTCGALRRRSFRVKNAGAGILPLPLIMSYIHKLSPEIANQIAAGEVIERPANAVKELVENAIDAGARRIEIEIEEGGKKLLRVRDDGMGMNGEDAVLALQRHATSKLRETEDLYQIRTLGFRGEALPSIASVSRMELVTRPHDTDIGMRLEIDAGTITDMSEAGCAAGTEITVRNLFYNTPARFKFLKSDAAESGRISEMVGHLALAYPHISFRLRSNGNETLRSEASSNPLNAVVSVMGRDIGRQVLPIMTNPDAQENEIRVSGFAGRPQLTRSNRNLQLIFVNGRLIRSRSLQHAIAAAYEGLLHGRDRFPVAVVFLDVPPNAVDVNVHPTKSEVRFAREWEVHHAMRVALRETLVSSQLAPDWGMNGHPEGVANATGPFGAPLPTGAPGTPGMPVPREGETGFNFPADDGVQPANTSYPQTIPADYRGYSQPVAPGGGSLGAFRAAQQQFGQMPMQVPVSNPVHTGMQGHLPDLAPPPADEQRKVSLRPLAQISNNAYILCEGDDGLYIVCQHRAHERILADKAIAAAEGRPSESQRLVIPFTAEVGPRALAAVEENSALLKDVGFEVEAFGGNSVLVRSVPSLVANRDYETVFHDLLDDLASGGAGKTLQERRRALLTMLSCKNAIKAGDPLQPEQMKGLIDDLLEVPNPSICPHGQPILIKISTLELDKKFEREYASR